jgi:hypothetical protein
VPYVWVDLSLCCEPAAVLICASAAAKSQYLEIYSKKYVNG